ncbi:hypothetical protein LAC81_34685 (plasmid) [Ensifer adhaerens]|uniref:hypothetical protein n=1 Tax=Ensifer adhaerens TaxID=106592 RepID=UPI001CBE68FC|nr:hypothetical protein [Ensifer adhaerens]MBZ7927106.1 hypothetical protein [Ensifer adhaerens]UAX98148.1 hypothetical protein LAC78_35985 [Ensifer adhaerens]UAY05530.1 hypothetical protein LAC80_34690 [Ensifer adhaerens]UAY12908.1 hypothetical protein LAC81_34685 [Ensifer adhaerens]
MPSRGKIVGLFAESDVYIDGLAIPAGFYSATERKSDVGERRKKSAMTYELHLNARNLKEVRGFTGDALGATLDATKAVQKGRFIVA